MNRGIIYPGSIPLETDLLYAQQQSMVGLSKLAAAVLGTSTLTNGLAVTQTAVASMNVQIAPGEIYAMANLEGTAYSSLPLDTTHAILKQGVLLDAALLALTAPGTGGFSTNYLIQATFAEVDGSAVTLPYYNASNPATAYSGPANAGTAQNTRRLGSVVLSAKAGTAATTGSQTTPAPDSGCVGIAVVTVANGAVTVVTGNINAYAAAPTLPSAGIVVGGFQNNAFITAAATGTADALAAAFAPVVASLVNGMTFYVRAASVNATATPTFAPNGLTAKTIVKGAGSALVAGDIAGAGHWIELQYDLTLDKWVLLNPATGVVSMSRNIFDKVDTQSVAFTKTGANTLQIKAGTVVNVLGTPVAFAAATSVTMPALSIGTDYAIYACQDGTVRADASFSAPVGYTTANSRQIGGFHYGLTAAATTVAGGSFATTGNGMIWVQSNVDDIAGINKFSLWDLKWRPRCNPAGMALASNQTWVDIYLCSTDTAANGTSKYNTNIASGTVLPKIPAAFNGNGTTTYPTLNWWVANELARANQKRLMWEHEFVDAAFGVTENQSIDATASTYPTTQRNAGYTSKYGIEQASGHQWTWGQDSSYDPQGTATPSNYDVNGNNGAGTGRGQDYLFTSLGLVRDLFGGSRTYGASSGSRASSWNYCPWNSYWNIGLRAACDHLILV